MIHMCSQQTTSALCCAQHDVSCLCATQVKNGRIAVLWLYRQLTEEDKDELLHEPLACYPVPFPRDSLLLADAGEPAGLPRPLQMSM